MPADTPSCPFCTIVGGAPADRVLDTDEVVAFLDVRPVFPGHVLVVPRAHIETLSHLPVDQVGPLFVEVQRTAAAVQAAMGAAGSFVGINNRISQSVPHLHVHVVPRNKGDGLRGFFWPRQRYSSAAEASAVAARIAAALDRA